MGGMVFSAIYPLWGCDIFPSEMRYIHFVDAIYALRHIVGLLRNGFENDTFQVCHSEERSDEESPALEILRVAQDDIQTQFVILNGTQWSEESVISDGGETDSSPSAQNDMGNEKDCHSEE